MRRQTGMDLHPPSQVLVRSADALRGTDVLVVDSPGGEIAPELRRWLPDAHITLVQTDYADYRAACRLVRASAARANADAPGRCASPSTIAESADRIRVVFTAWYGMSARPHDLAILYLPKGRALLEMVVAMVGGVVDASARIWLVGSLRGGIRSGRRAMEGVFQNVTKHDAARHCVLYSATAPGRPTPKEAGRAVTLEDQGRSYTFQVAGRRVDVWSCPGVFSHGRLDDGTRLLLESFDTRPGSPVLDFGCGCGVVGAWVHGRWPGVEIDLVDSGAFAIEAARRTARANGIAAERVWPSDVFSDVTGRYGTIVSNPPFHAGVRTDYRAVEAFLAEAAARIKPGGTLRIVANRFLRYPGIIGRAIGPHRVVAEDARYRVYDAVVERCGGKG